jgi:hypothetical protein
MIPEACLDFNFSENNGRHRLCLHLPFRRPQLLFSEGPTADSAAPPHMRQGQRMRSALGLPNFRQFTLA